MPRQGTRAFTSALHRRADIVAVIALGGAIGTVARWGIGRAMPAKPGGFPWATFLVNISGAFVMGVFVMIALQLTGTHRYLRPFVGVGVLGGYTTFSTYMLETRDLAVGAHEATSALYLFGTLVIGLAAVFAGMVIGRAAPRLLSHRGRSAPDNP